MRNDFINQLPPSRTTYRPPTIELVRELKFADLDRLSLKLPPSRAPIKRARAIHHRQAQLLAEGRTTSEVAAIVGSTPKRIYDLQNDETFSELITYYKNQCDDIELETQRRVQIKLVDVLELATDEIQDRLIDDDQRRKIPLPELRKIAEFAGDRSIAPPRATQQGSALPPTRIELNFGYKPPELPEPKTINVEVLEHEHADATNDT